MGLTGVTHLLTCLLGASWRGLAQGPLRVPPYMEHGWSISQASLWSLPRACQPAARILDPVRCFDCPVEPAAAAGALLPSLCRTPDPVDPRLSLPSPHLAVTSPCLCPQERVAQLETLQEQLEQERRREPSHA